MNGQGGPGQTIYCVGGFGFFGRSPSPPGPPGPGPRRWGRYSSGVSLPSPFLSSFFSAAEALAISSASMVPSPFASSAAMMGEGGGRCPAPPGPPGPPWPPSRWGGPALPGGGCLTSWATDITAGIASASAITNNLVFILCFDFFRPNRPHRTRCSQGYDSSERTFHISSNSSDATDVKVLCRVTGRIVKEV